MAAFSAHQLYRPQIKIRARRNRITQLVEELLAETGTVTQVRHLAGILRAGARPYAMVCLTAKTPHRAIYTLSVYAEQMDVDRDDPALLTTRQDSVLGTLAVRRIDHDDGLPGVRALSRLPALRIDRYRPGQRLLVRLDDRDHADVYDALDLRNPHEAPGFATDFVAASLLLGTPLKPQPRLLKQLGGVAYSRAQGLVLARVVTSSDAEDAIRALAIAHARVSTSQHRRTDPRGPDQMCWASIDILQSLIRAQPGLVDLGTTLIGNQKPCAAPRGCADFSAGASRH